MIDRLPTHDRLLNEVAVTDPAQDFETAHRVFTDLLQAVDHGTLRLPNDEALEQEVRDAWSRYECILEAQRSLNVLDSPSPREMIGHYDLLPRYREFLQTDAFFLSKCRATEATDVPHLLMVGSGPLPLTSYIFGKSDAGFGYEVTNVDTSGEALKVGQQILEHTGLDQAFMHTSGADMSVDASVTGVIVAALAGGSKAEKMDIIRNIAAQAQPGTRINVRYGTGVRRLFYPECILTDEECSENGLLRVGSFEPPRKYMNAIGVYEVC